MISCRSILFGISTASKIGGGGRFAIALAICVRMSAVMVPKIAMVVSYGLCAFATTAVLRS
jgi:hypothetical protein